MSFLVFLTFSGIICLQYTTTGVYNIDNKKEGEKTMKEYKGYTIERITRKDWMVKDAAGEILRTEDDRPTTLTLKAAKELIDRKEQSR